MARIEVAGEHTFNMVCFVRAFTAVSVDQQVLELVALEYRASIAVPTVQVLAKFPHFSHFQILSQSLNGSENSWTYDNTIQYN